MTLAVLNVGTNRLVHQFTLVHDDTGYYLMGNDLQRIDPQPALRSDGEAFTYMRDLAATAAGSRKVTKVDLLIRPCEIMAG